MVMKVEKVISALPGTLDPDTIYLVRTGPGFELYVSDTTGAISYEPNELGKSYFIESFEENGAINTTTNGGEHWAVGNGAELTGVNGIQIPLNCKLIGAASTANTGSFTVEVYRNEAATGFTIPTTSGADNVTNPSGGSIDIQAGDRIKLRTTAVSAATVGTVTLLFSTNETTFAGTSIGDLNDVDLTGVADGDGIIWSASNSRFEVGSAGGGTDVATVQSIAAGSTLGLQQKLLADAGQPGLTVLAVGFTTSGKVQGISLGAGNVVEVYASGADFNSGTVLYREFMSFGEPICFTGLSNGAIITSTQGFYGFSEQLDGSDESPMPLLSYGLSFETTFFFGFRNSDSYLPGGAGANQGWVHVVNGPLESTVALRFGFSGFAVQGQENITLDPWEYRRLYTDGNVEYILEGSAPIMACVNAQMDLSPQGAFYDSRLIMPLTNDGITWPRSGFVSAIYNGTVVDWWTRDNAEGTLNNGNGINPGTPIDFDAAAPTGTGAADADYEPNGATRVKAIGLISAYSGADSAGLEASPLMPTSAMSQIVAQPIFITDEGDGGNSGVAIASPYEGTARIYSWNDATSSLDLEYTVPLTRNGVTVTTQDDQNHPTAGGVMNDAVSGVVTLVGQLNPGVIIADVPITVVVQSGGGTITGNTLRSQNGTTTTSIINDDDETLTLGITPSSIAVEIREDANGLLRKRVIDGSGAETWVLV